jgi:hypothetical protein
MHTGDDRVRGNNKRPPAAAIDYGCVIEQAEPARSGERREEAMNALELTEGFSGDAACHGF